MITNGPAGTNGMRFLIALLGLVFLTLSAHAEEKRIALLIGNNEYSAQLGKLSNTHNDVNTMKAALENTGFEVITKFDLNRVNMLSAIHQFTTSITLAWHTKDSLSG